MLLAFTTPVNAEEPRTLLKAPPRINGREVKELILTAPVSFGGSLGRGMPIIRNYTVKPGRFVPVSENEWYVHYQAAGALSEGNGEPGGLAMDKKYPDRILTYWGDAHYPKIKLMSYDVFSPADARKIRVHYVK
ncbi:MAG: hypothetical protein M3128_00870 [Verrucomicrobiota bacterium]|nr:hypothetical protein [Verrucomicrobiota bacterium]